ncbi:MAG: hypothetical protein LBU37_01250 [Tannerellaceae bacterium]|jgi:hypothetical protein|nr:hypothetical protein [Tannerellaceae bacterium]
MKTHTKIIRLLLCLTLSPGLYAQVTVGIDEAPAKGALLQLKDTRDAVSNGGKNAGKGLLMPRVWLNRDTLLAPMLPSATLKQKKEHTGLLVYNLTENEDMYLKKGLMVWNGQEWNYLSIQKRNTKDAGIKKILYHSVTALDSKNIKFDFMEVSLEKSPQSSQYSYPRIVLPALPASTRTFHYQFTQYWPGKTDANGALIGKNKDGKYETGGYSNDVMKATFSQSNKTTPVRFIQSSMSTTERNQVWMIDDTTGDVYHFNFFVMGKDSNSAVKIFAILGEYF